jgi:hypothetical protein
MRYGVRAVPRPPPVVEGSLFRGFLEEGEGWALAREVPEACGRLLVALLVAVTTAKRRDLPPAVILHLLDRLEGVRRECLQIVKPDDLGDFIAGIQNELRPSEAGIRHRRPRGRDPR